MFKEFINENKIPPNLLNSILTNNALYEMFKDDFENNREYFQMRSKEEYIDAILKFLEEKLFSGNIFSVNDNTIQEDIMKSSKVADYIRKFYDDFLLDEFKTSASSIFKIPFFKGLNYAKKYDKYASESDKFLELYDYIFYQSIDYEKTKSELLTPILEKLSNREKLSMIEFDTLCNYVKNNIDGYVDMDIVTAMIKNHAYKTNHIFDSAVVKELLKSTARDYLSNYDITCEIRFDHLIKDFKDMSTHEINPNVITIENILIDTFISGNYVELFNTLFYEMSIVKHANLLIKNEVDYETLKVLMTLINEKVDVDKIFMDESYEPYNYFSDLKASAFIKTLRFYQILGVDLFSNYIDNRLKNINLNEESRNFIPKKEVSLEMIFQSKFSKMNSDKIKKYLAKYRVLNLFYDKSGYKRRTLDIIKKANNDEYKDAILSYLHSAIILPETMIEDVSDLLNYKSKNTEINTIVENLLKYIYVDSFYYSLNSFLKLNTNKSNFNQNEYLDDLTIKVSCIKDTPLSHRFIDEALFVIEEAKQNS